MPPARQSPKGLLVFARGTALALLALWLLTLLYVLIGIAFGGFRLSLPMLLFGASYVGIGVTAVLAWRQPAMIVVSLALLLMAILGLKLDAVDAAREDRERCERLMQDPACTRTSDGFSCARDGGREHIRSRPCPARDDRSAWIRP